MRLNLRRVVVAAVGLIAISGTALAGKIKVKECNCSINPPSKWYTLEYYKTPAGVEYLVTASPFQETSEKGIPGVQFLRQTFEAGDSGTAEEFLSAIAEQLKAAKGTATPPAASKLGGLPGARMDIVYKGTDGKSYNQRYYATIRENAAYVVIITWADPNDLPKLEESAASVKF